MDILLRCTPQIPVIYDVRHQESRGSKEDSLLIAKLKSFNNIRAIQKIVVLYLIYAIRVQYRYLLTLG